jgi:hypothetical protein
MFPNVALISTTASCAQTLCKHGSICSDIYTLVKLLEGLWLQKISEISAN